MPRSLHGVLEQRECVAQSVPEATFTIDLSRWQMWRDVRVAIRGALA